MEDWKKDRLSVEIHESEKEIMAKAAEERKQEEDDAWQDVKTDLYVGESEYDKHIDSVLDYMRESGYNLPIRK